jgi:SSS family solute:Na+ symporter
MPAELLRWDDHLIIGLSLAATVAVGLYFARKWRSSEDFFLAGRSVTWVFIGFSLFATNISSEHFVGLAAGGHSKGLVQGGYEWIASYCLLMLALVFAPQYLRHKVYTIPEYFEKRYGVEVRLTLTVYFLVMIVLTKTTVALYSGAIVIRHFTGWDIAYILWGVGLITAVYTMAGGLAAVIYTDFIQAVVLIIGSVVLTLAALGDVGGWESLVARLDAAGQSGHLSMVRPPTDPALPFSGFLLGNFLIGGLFYWCMDQVNVQRVLGAKSIGHASGGAVFAGFLKIIPVFIMVLPGVIALVLYPDIEDSNTTYGILVERLLPHGLRGLVIAALLAALMSSLSSAFNSVATIVARDLLVRLRPGTGMRAQVLAGNLALLAVMAAGILATPLVATKATIWDYLQEVTGYLSVPFAVAGLLGTLSRRLNRRGAMAGVGVGIIAGLFFFLESTGRWGLITSPYLASFLHRSFISGVLTAAAMFAVSALTAPPSEEVRRGDFSLFARAGGGAGPRPRVPLYADYRAWAAVLFAVVTALWIIFR